MGCVQIWGAKFNSRRDSVPLELRSSSILIAVGFNPRSEANGITHSPKANKTLRSVQNKLTKRKTSSGCSPARATCRNKKNPLSQNSSTAPLDRGCVSRKKVKRELSLAYESESCALALRHNFRLRRGCMHTARRFGSPNGECVIPFASRTPLPPSNAWYRHWFMFVPAFRFAAARTPLPPSISCGLRPRPGLIFGYVAVF